MQFIDQIGNQIHLKFFPKRIVSLVPSITELLFALDLDNEIVGITDYCIFPKQKIPNYSKIGGPKSLKIDLIDQLKPDLIIGCKEENEKNQILFLKEKYSVWLADVTTYKKALNMILSIGGIVNKKSKSEKMVKKIENGFENFDPFPPIKASFLIWKNPYIVAANNTFINSLLQKLGLVNVFSSYQRYPEIEINEIKNSELLLLTSEPYHFTKDDKDDLNDKFPQIKTVLVDGTYFSWYGSRMIQSVQYFKVLKEEINYSLPILARSNLIIDH